MMGRVNGRQELCVRFADPCVLRRGPGLSADPGALAGQRVPARARRGRHRAVGVWGGPARDAHLDHFPQGASQGTEGINNNKAQPSGMHLKPL